MTFEEIKVRSVCGMSAGARRKPAELPVRVKVLDKLDHKDWRKRRIRVRHIDAPTDGLEEWVSPSRLLSEWRDVKRIIRDEEREQRLVELGLDYDQVVLTAIDIVLHSTGEEHLHSPYRGALSIPATSVAQVQRMAERAGFKESVDVQTVRDAFIDRHDTAYYPVSFVEKLARAFAAAEPETVTRHIEHEEGELKAKGYLPGESFSHLWLEKQQPSYALARAWAGFDNEVKALREQIQRLAQVCESAAYALEAAGKEDEAARVRRAIRGL